ncbi:hypothetical protein LX77_03118 [Gelidibacter algens]|uniref:BAAT/Acyl-CoA thioester hydrolase C-terminal domain-containing protein n=1 Tax=Gelidibacter algens TaxID=49280 RepID=A0A1A7R1Y7_9FLAO|nr:acyl-CoA thioester hydrolase/BAAT C-terminal domain-containing protein [Gelidibacter algens]OBX25841.1 hypothetical protein A9996_07905 [Gelidibacter algens]RAJ20593.1 hypothetical protein LX77_03118 [Gelidibacter algens]
MKSLIYSVIFLIGITHAVQVQDTKTSALVYEWFPPKSQKFPAVLVLGGSEGGLNFGQQWAKVLTQKGFGVMALAYFGEPCLPAQLEEVPLEYFQSALSKLKTLPGVDGNHISVISVSKGTEAALLLASEDKSIKLVVAASPSHAVWQSVNREGYATPKSSWTKDGLPLPFLLYDYSRGYYPIVNFYLGAMEKQIDEKTIIPMENSAAVVILLSGGQDQFWPSTAMANNIEHRLKAKEYKYDVKHLDFPDAGHGFLVPFATEEDKKQIISKMNNVIAHFGGTIDAFKEAMTKSVEFVLSQLEKTK